MSDPEPEKKKPRRRLWLRVVLVLLALGLLAAAGAGFFVVNNLTRLTRWAVNRALPAAQVEIGDVRIDGLSQIAVEKLVVRERKTGTEVLRLDGGSVVFSYDRIWKWEIGEVRLMYPVITVSSAIGRLIPQGGGSASGRRGPWSLTRLVCDYGEVRFTSEGESGPVAGLKFTFDWQNVGSADSGDDPLSLTVWDLRAGAKGFPGSFLVLDVVRIVTTPASLLQRQTIDSVALEGGRMTVGEALERVFSGSPGSGAPLPAWKIGKLAISNVAVRLDDKRPGIPDIAFVLNTSFQDLPLANTADAVGELPQSIKITDLEVLSPNDPLAKVFTLREVIIGFHLSGLLRHRIDFLTVNQPTVYVDKDLFWYMEDAQKRMASNGDSASPSWTIGRLDVQAGSLVVGSSGRTQYGLPLNFRASATDVELDNLASLKLETAFEIPAVDYRFEDYQLEVATQGGDLRFSYPPEKAEKNLVGKVFVDRIVWRQFRADDAWISTTFDARGINGAFGGEAYGGYIEGGFSFFFDSSSPWIGWISGAKVSLRELTDVVAPQNFRMTGPIDFRLQMDAFGKNIERIKADFQALKPGRMTITKLDDFLENIPPEWGSLKASSTRIALEALRDFEYTSAVGDLWFVTGQGRVDLRLQGPLGSRTFDVVLHADDSKEGRWKQEP